MTTKTLITHSRDKGSIGILIKLHSKTENASHRQWRATPLHRGNLESVDYKDMRALKSYLLGVSSHLLPAFHIKEAANTASFITTKRKHTCANRKVAGVVERAALEMR